MSRRLYFLVPNAEVCREVTAELQEAGVPENHIHLISNHRQHLDEIPEAGLLATTELAWGLEWGVGLGGLAGFLGGLLTMMSPPEGWVIGGWALLTCAAAGAVFGALVSSLVASDIPNHELKELEIAIAAGAVLMLVDIPKAEVEARSDEILKHHPEALIGISRPPALT